MKVCIINPPYIKKHYSTIILKCPTPSIAYIGVSLMNRNHEIFLLDAKLENLSLKDVIRKISKISPDVVGISTVTADMPIVRKLAKSVKEINKKAFVVIGGAHPSAQPLETLRDEPNFDASVIGEGEITFPILLEAFNQREDLNCVQGIAFREGNEVKVNSPRLQITNLDDIPLPKWKYLPPGKMYYVQVSRGCPASCSFCYRLFGNRVRVNSADRVVEEIEYIMSYTTPDEFFLSAATFGIPRKHSMEVLDAIIESGLNKKIRWRAVTRTDIGDVELFARMKAAGCYKVGLGIESGDEYILKKTGKNTKLNDIRKCMNTVKSAGLESMGFFIIGHPYETKESAKKTSDFAIELNPTILSIGTMTPWPGTRVYDLAISGEAGYYMPSSKEIEGQHKHFGKRTMYFKNYKISYIQWLKIRTYFLLYWNNRRFSDGLRFFISYFREGVFLLWEASLNLFSKR